MSKPIYREYSIAYGKKHYSHIKKDILEGARFLSRFPEVTGEWEDAGERTTFICSIGRVVEVYLNKQGKFYAYSKDRGTMYDGVPSPRYELVLDPEKIDSTAFDYERYQRTSFANTQVYKGNEKAIELIKSLEKDNKDALRAN